MSLVFDQRWVAGVVGCAGGVGEEVSGGFSQYAV
jgi:hypothetical protein